jgi:hypothetical protein
MELELHFSYHWCIFICYTMQLHLMAHYFPIRQTATEKFPNSIVSLATFNGIEASGRTLWASHLVNLVRKVQLDDQRKLCDIHQSGYVPARRKWREQQKKKPTYRHVHVTESWLAGINSRHRQSRIAHSIYSHGKLHRLIGNPRSPTARHGTADSLSLPLRRARTSCSRQR